MHTITNLDGGTPGASIELARNRHTNPDLNVNTDGWGYYGGPANLSITRYVLPIGEVNLTRPGAVAHFEATAAGIASAWLGPAIPVTPGERIAASFYARRGGGWTGNATPRIDWNDGTRVTGAPVAMQQATYERCTVLATVPEGKTTARLNMLLTAMAATNVVRARMAQIETGPTVGTYLDGNTPDLPDENIFYDWVGTPAASPSIMRRQAWSILNRTRPLAVAGYAAARRSRNEFHDLLDGSIGVSFVPPRPRNGTLVTVYDNRADAHAALSMYAAGRLFRYAHPDLPELGMDFALDGNLDVEQDPADTNVWYVLVGYQEV